MRKKYIRVEEINLVRLANAEFMNFMERFLSLLPLEAEGEPESDEMGAPKLSITAEQVTEAKGYLAQMNDLTRIPQMKVETKPKEEVDRKRDSLISLLFSRVKTSRSVPIEAESKAAEQLYIVISPYRQAAVQSGDGDDQRVIVGLAEVGKQRGCTHAGTGCVRRRAGQLQQAV